MKASTFLAPALLGAVLGPALQLQQPALWPLASYLACMVAGVLAALACLLLSLPGWLRRIALLLAVAVLAAGATGARALAYLDDALDPALEGRELVLTRIVAALAQ